MTPLRLIALAAAAWGMLWLPPLRAALEGTMALHMAVQMPVLVALGALLAINLRRREPHWFAAADWLGIPGVAAVVLGSSFWMLPRALDQAVADPAFDLVKFLTLPLLVGLPLGLSWRRMPPLGRAFIWANFIPKLGAVGGLYLGAPARLCAYYRLDQQQLAGWTLIAIATALGLTWFVAAFVGWTPSCAERTDKAGDKGFEVESEGRQEIGLGASLLIWRVLSACVVHGPTFGRRA
jgi:hypothetical protein